MTDIVERLRRIDTEYPGFLKNAAYDAADLIERLRKENLELRDELNGFQEAVNLRAAQKLAAMEQVVAHGLRHRTEYPEV